jgi:hypothetical protein
MPSYRPSYNSSIIIRRSLGYGLTFLSQYSYLFLFNASLSCTPQFSTSVFVCIVGRHHPEHPCHTSAALAMQAWAGKNDPAHNHGYSNAVSRQGIRGHGEYRAIRTPPPSLSKKAITTVSNYLQLKQENLKNPQSGYVIQ